jgi:CheY-like chemotaxis protein
MALMRPDLSGLRVLIVEDEGLVSMLVEEILEGLGCRVVAVAARLRDAMVHAAAMAFDAAVLDVNLAGELSYPVATLLRQRKIPFVFATGYGNLAVPAELDMVPVLAKPFRTEQLAHALGLAVATAA